MYSILIFISYIFKLCYNFHMNTLTEELFYKDLYANEFIATVTNVENINNYFEITLDKTLFYPEGGGQYGDSGYINDIKVVDTYEKNNYIVHKTYKPLNIGEQVYGKLDFQRRYQNMQTHSGEHIVSGIINKLFGYNNVGFHMNDNIATMDYDGYISPEQLENIELQCNKVIADNLPIIEHIYENSNLCKYNYRSKKEINTKIRIIEIPGIDMCACCGTHTKSCSEIGLIHFISCIKYKSGCRITAVIGNNALKYLLKLQNSISYICNKLSSNLENVETSINNIIDNNSILKSNIVGANRRIASLLIDKLVEDNKCLHLHNCNLDMDNLIFMSNNIELNNYEYLILESDNKILIKSKNDISNILTILKDKNIISGGGKSNIITGKLIATFDELIKLLNK